MPHGTGNYSWGSGGYVDVGCEWIQPFDKYVESWDNGLMDGAGTIIHADGTKERIETMHQNNIRLPDRQTECFSLCN